MTDNPAITAILDDFDFLDDWEERYRHVIELGKAMPALDEAARREKNKVKGCVSQVWLDITPEPGPPARLHMRGDSDAHIVRGLVALLVRLYSGRTAQEILDTDAVGLFASIGLADNLSPQRSNGLSAMINRIRQTARISLERS